MKRLLILLLILIPCLCYGQEQVARMSPMIVGGGVPAEAGCSMTPAESITATVVGGVAVARYDSQQSWYTYFTSSGGAHTICAIDLSMKLHGTVTGTLTVCIYTTSGGDPSALVGTCGTILESTWTNAAAFEYKTVTGISATLDGSSTYDIVIYNSTYDANNYLEWETTNTGGARKYAAYPWVAWSLDDPTSCAFKAYK